MAHQRENTLAAFAYARSMGITAMETDAWVTADGVAVLHHDARVRTTTGRRSIREVAQSDLPGHVPSLSALYDVCGSDVHVVVDVMDAAAAPAIVNAAVAAGGTAARHLWLCATDIDLLASWRALHPDIRLVHSDAQWRRHRRHVADHAAVLRARGIDVLNLPHRHCSAAVVTECHDHGIALFAWGVARIATMRRLRDAGVDGVMSDHCDRLVAAFGASR